MRRVFSFILISALLLSTAAVCGTGVSAAETEKKPFYFSNWDAVDSRDFPNIWSKAYFWATREGENVTVTYGGGNTPATIAAALKKDFDKYPVGVNMRIINVTPMERKFLVEMIEDHIYMTKGATAMAEWMDAFLKEYARIGGKLDGIYSDLEYIHGLNWYLFSEAYNKGDKEVYYNIISNPEYKTKVRPMLEERGFKFYPNTTDKTRTELYSLHPYAGQEYETSKLIWDNVMHNLWRDYLDQAIFVPLRKYFPKADFWDYRGYDSYAWMKDIPETARNEYLGGNTSKAGSHSSNTAYNYAPWTPWVQKGTNSTTYKKPTSHNDAIYEDNPFNMTLWEVNSFKNMYAATDTKDIEVTFAYFDYALMHSKVYEKGTTSSGTPYHAEAYFHAGLLDAEFGGYIMQNEVGSVPEYQYRLEFVAAVMDELTRVVGYVDRKPIEVPANWNDSFILSGMYANGRNVWRITPDTVSGVSKKDFLVKDKDGQVVFSNKGQTITFPQGKIIKDGFVPAVGTCGYWVETPADVKPVITTDKDRYSKYPAFGENFDAFQSRSDFDPAKTKYSHTWEVLGLDSSSVTIKESQDSASDKVLAVQGNAYVNNITVPKLLTAGDNYAQQQAWEVTFSLASLPKGDAEVKLLTAASGSSTDGGFRIYNGKLYCGQVGSYHAFENISLAAGMEYTLKRTVDFRSFTGNYYVYDAEGKLLGKAENVALLRQSLPIEKVGFSTAKFGDNTVFLDNYKLYAIGVTADFEIYDASTGIKIEASNSVQDTDTAYRLSWINASDKAKCYNVVAAYSGGDREIVATIDMMPGSDGVSTGIVDAHGKSVFLSLEETEVRQPDTGDDSSGDETTDSTEDDTQDNTENDNYNDGTYGDESTATEDTATEQPQDKQNSGGTSPVLLIVIIVVIVAAACALAFVLVKRNMPQKASAEEIPEEPELSTTDDLSQIIAETVESAEAEMDEKPKNPESE